MLHFLRTTTHLAVALALTTTLLAPVQAADAAPEVDRLSGPDRVATAAAVARDAFPDGAETVVMAGREGIADALAGAVLAREVGGPILLVDQDRVAGPVREALHDLGAQRIVLLGGRAVISDAVAAELAEGFDVQRVAGQDRFATAAAIAERVSGGQIEGHRTVLLGGGSAYPEVLAAAPLSHVGGAPILLTNGTHLSSATAASISRLDPDRLIILGGEGRVSHAVAQQVSELGGEVRRIAGANPLDSARAIADSLVRDFGFDPAEVILARGDDVGDAVAGGVLAGVRNAPIALAESPSSLGPAEGM
ncbi:MAG TPA: cell wall-binding repeat-containing protein, partial [Euzebya sp.]|nr:cell wall-binding repeat-containing protein [Euzebya sp.]